MKPPVDRLVRAPDERSNIPIGQPGVVQERPEDTLFKPLSAINDLLQMSELEIRSLIKHCIRAPYDYAHSARIDVDLYAQRPRTETVNSAIKRSHGGAERAHFWYREFW